MRIAVRGSGFEATTKALENGASQLGDEDLIREAMHEAAQPVADRAKEIIRKRSGKTADDIAVRDEPSAPGVVRVAIGGSGGKHGRAWIMALLEFYGVGKSKVKYPFMRPALDSEGGPRLSARFVAALRKRLRWRVA